MKVVTPPCLVISVFFHVAFSRSLDNFASHLQHKSKVSPGERPAQPYKSKENSAGDDLSAMTPEAHGAASLLLLSSRERQEVQDLRLMKTDPQDYPVLKLFVDLLRGPCFRLFKSGEPVTGALCEEPRGPGDGARGSYRPYHQATHLSERAE